MLEQDTNELTGARYIWHVDDAGFQGLVWRTESLEGRRVNIDYDPRGNIIGVEIL